MRKKFLGTLLILVICIVGCGKSDASEPRVTSGESATNEQETTSTKSENKTEKDEFETTAEFLDLRIGDTVCVASAGLDEIWQYKFTLNSIEYAAGEINDYDGEGDGFVVADITLEGVGPDVNYGIILTELYIGRSNQFTPEHQESYGLNVFSNPDDVLSEGEKVTGKIAIRYGRKELTIEKRSMETTKYIYTVEESEIKDYVPGQQ